MKRLFIILLSSFFFSASLYSNTGSLSKELSTEHLDGCTSCKEAISHVTGSDCDAIMNRPTRRTTGSTAQSKPISLARLIDACVPALTDLLDNKRYFLSPYLHCKPLPLQLIFPQHYFW